MDRTRIFARTLAAALLIVIFAVLGDARVSVAQTTDPVLQTRHPRYALQPDDVLTLTFPLTPELNQTLTVQPDGYINLQNAGSIYVQGLSTPDLVLALKTSYQGVLHDPIINVDITDFQKPFFTVSGQVAKPGQYDLRTDITVAEAIAVAGGMTSVTAKTQIFLLRRTSKDYFAVTKVNLRDVYRGKNVDEDPLLHAGDMVYVPEKFIAKFRKYVPYTLGSGTYLQTNPL